MTELMNAVLLTGYGGPEKLVYTQVAKPSPQAGEVLIKVGACSVNNTDINTRTGWYAAEQEFEAVLQDTATQAVRTSTAWGGAFIEFPRIQGADIVGKVVEVGENVDPQLLEQRAIVDPWVRDGHSGAGDRYVGSELDGGFAEYAVIPASNVYPIASPLSDVELACFPCSYSTAENMAVKGRVTGNDTVLIMGASGGVGSALIQLCKLRGATAIAIASKSKHNFVRQLGADRVGDRANPIDALGDRKITVYLDTVGGGYFPQLLKHLQVGGRYVACGAIGGPLIQLDLRELIYKDLEMIGATRMEASVFQRLANYINQNRLKPAVSQTFPLSQIQAAQKFFQSKSFCGKVVISMNEG